MEIPFYSDLEEIWHTAIISMNRVAIVGYDAGGLVTDPAHFDQFINGLVVSAAFTPEGIEFSFQK